MFEEIMNIVAKFLLGIYMAKDNYRKMMQSINGHEILIYKVFYVISILFSIVSFLGFIELIVNGR